MCSVRTVLLFYKRLIEPGGAERLLLHEYEELTQLGYQVQIVTYELRDKALFGFQRDQLHIIELLGSPSQSWWQLVQLCRLHRQDIWLCASGHIDIFLASIIAGSRYALHVHHPAFMSFNDYDKYSIFLQSHFEDLLRSNFGAVRFQKIREQLTIAQKIRLNIRAALSILSLKKASEIFVLSTYAQQ